MCILEFGHFYKNCGVVSRAFFTYLTIPKSHNFARVFNSTPRILRMPLACLPLSLKDSLPPFFLRPSFTLSALFAAHQAGSNSLRKLNFRTGKRAFRVFRMPEATPVISTSKVYVFLRGLVESEGMEAEAVAILYNSTLHTLPLLLPILFICLRVCESAIRLLFS